MSMWEPFTEPARRAIVRAQEEAQRLGSNMIGTEHILLGIIGGKNLAVRVLTTLGFDLTKIRAGVEANVDPGSEFVRQEMVFSARAKRVIELAFEEARKLNYNYIGTETILLGIVREANGVGGRALKSLGVDAERVRAQTIALVKAEKDGPEP